MRELKYQLTNGTIVNTLAEAQKSGQDYEAICVEEPHVSYATEKQREMRKLFGKAVK